MFKLTDQDFETYSENPLEDILGKLENMSVGSFDKDQDTELAKNMGMFFYSLSRTSKKQNQALRQMLIEALIEAGVYNKRCFKEPAHPMSAPDKALRVQLKQFKKTITLFDIQNRYDPQRGGTQTLPSANAAAAQAPQQPSVNPKLTELDTCLTSLYQYIRESAPRSVAPVQAPKLSQLQGGRPLISVVEDQKQSGPYEPLNSDSDDDKAEDLAQASSRCCSLKKICWTVGAILSTMAATGGGVLMEGCRRAKGYLPSSPFAPVEAAVQNQNQGVAAYTIDQLQGLAQRLFFNNCDPRVLRGEAAQMYQRLLQDINSIKALVSNLPSIEPPSPPFGGLSVCRASESGGSFNMSYPIYSGGPFCLPPDQVGNQTFNANITDLVHVSISDNNLLPYGAGDLYTGFLAISAIFAIFSLVMGYIAYRSCRNKAICPAMPCGSIVPQGVPQEKMLLKLFCEYMIGFLDLLIAKDKSKGWC